MKITAILNTHGATDVTLDTLDSIKYYMTNRILLLVDGVAWKDYEFLPTFAYKLKGFHHGLPKSPFRNVVLGLLAAALNWEDTNWFCYIEYDCLVGSSAFRKDLLQAEKEGVFCLGNDLRINEDVDLSLVETMIKTKFEERAYLLGACIFYHSSFIKTLLEQEFFQRFLFYTNHFSKGFFPFFKAWDLTEHLLPSIAKCFGGGVKQLAAYNYKMNKWSGNYRRYPIRFRPELTYELDHFLQASIMHPLKTYDHPIRKYHRTKRCQLAK